MKGQTTNELLRKLMFQKGGKSRLGIAWITLFTGVVLLLCAVMIWWNFRELLHGKRDNDSLGSTFLTVSKKITNQTMASHTASLFTPQEIDDLKKAPQVQDVGMLSSNHFPVSASMGSTLSFYTELFLEAVPERFMDKKPADWKWQEGSSEVPIIVSTEFLNLYNYGFAPSQGLPQLSETTIQSLGFQLNIGAGAAQEHYIGHIVGFSDRINSVLVPEAFLSNANARLAPGASEQSSRLILKTSDPSDKKFEQYLEEHDYTTNAEQMRWNRIRSVVEVVSIATGVLALLLTAISALVFVLFIELTLARAKDAIQLLLQLGYSPQMLAGFVFRRFVPVLFAAIGAAVTVAALIQVGLSFAVKKMELNIAFVPGWPVWLVAVLSALCLLQQMRTTIRKALYKL
ncbi:hypothetical protein ACTHGU_20935 [Chitinophagaceae bacterium MMS25-I14]